MAFRDLREFIQELEKRGELFRMPVLVDPELEITEIADRVSKGPASHNKAILFERVKGSDMPVLINAFGSASRMALALNVADLEQLNHDLAKTIDLRLPQGMGAALNRGRDLLKRLRSIGLGPKIVKTAPVQEIVTTGINRRWQSCRFLNAGRRTAGGTSRCRKSSRAIRSRTCATSACIACRCSDDHSIE